MPRVWKQHGYHSENLVVKEGDVALCLTIVIERREISPQNIQTCQSNWDMLKTNPVSEAKVTKVVFSLIYLFRVNWIAPLCFTYCDK